MENCQQITVSLNLPTWDGSIDRQQSADYIMVENFNRVYRKQGHGGASWKLLSCMRSSGCCWCNGLKDIFLHTLGPSVPSDVPKEVAS